MPPDDGHPAPDVTTLLEAINAGAPGSLDRLLALVYDELRGMARAKMARERSRDHQATELVHEAFFKLFAGTPATWHDRRHMFGAAGRAMEQLLVDWARHAQRAKRGGGWERVPIENLTAHFEHDPTEVIAISDALAKLEALDERKATVVRLRYFGGLNVDEAAEALGVSAGTIKGDWKYARAWLQRELAAGEKPTASLDVE